MQRDRFSYPNPSFGGLNPDALPFLSAAFGIAAAGQPLILNSNLSQTAVLDRVFDGLPCESGITYGWLLFAWLNVTVAGAFNVSGYSATSGALRNRSAILAQNTGAASFGSSLSSVAAATTSTGLIAAIAYGTTLSDSDATFKLDTAYTTGTATLQAGTSLWTFQLQ